GNEPAWPAWKSRAPAEFHGPESYTCRENPPLKPGGSHIRSPPPGRPGEACAGVPQLWPLLPQCPRLNIQSIDGSAAARSRSAQTPGSVPSQAGAPMDARHAILSEPVSIGPKTLPNRFYQVPHASGFGSARPMAQAAFRAIKAEGGWGGVCVEYAPISPDSDETPAIAADIWDDRDARALGLAAEAIHNHRALAALELYHGGASSPNGGSRTVRLAPSQLTSGVQ